MSKNKDTFSKKSAPASNVERMRTLIAEKQDTSADILALFQTLTDKGEKQECARLLQTNLIETLTELTKTPLIPADMSLLIQLLGPEGLSEMLGSDLAKLKKEFAESSDGANMQATINIVSLISETLGDEADSFIQDYKALTDQIPADQKDNPIFHFCALEAATAGDKRFAPKKKGPDAPKFGI